MQTKLDVLDFKTGNVIGAFEVPTDSLVTVSDPSYLDFISNYLYRTKKASFVKTSSTKGISQIAGTTKKPFKQKGTGNARQGSLRSPQFRGGAVIFGPLPITANYKINKKEVKLAKKVLLAQLIMNSLIKVVDNVSDVAKTKDFIECKSKIVPSAERVLFVDSAIDGKSTLGSAYLAGRNVMGVSFDLGLHFNIYRVSRHDAIVITKDALKKLVENLFN